MNKTPEAQNIRLLEIENNYHALSPDEFIKKYVDSKKSEAISDRVEMVFALALSLSKSVKVDDPREVYCALITSAKMRLLEKIDFDLIGNSLILSNDLDTYKKTEELFPLSDYYANGVFEDFDEQASLYLDNRDGFVFSRAVGDIQGNPFCTAIELESTHFLKHMSEKVKSLDSVSFYFIMDALSIKEITPSSVSCADVLLNAKSFKDMLNKGEDIDFSNVSLASYVIRKNNQNNLAQTLSSPLSSQKRAKI